MRLAAALLALCLALTAAAATAQDGATRAFGDWTSACTPSGYCSATTTAGVDGSEPPARYVFTVGRHTEQSYWELSFAAFGPMPDPWSDFTLVVDGTPAVFSLSDAVGAYGSDRHFYFLGDGAQAVMDRLAPGTTIEVGFTDVDGAPHEIGFSLAGLTAALLWIDEQQRRVGAERVASAPPYGLVPVYAGEVAPDIPLALLNRHRADPECLPFEELANGRDFVVGDLGEGQTLYLIPCQSGAYNFAQKVYVGSSDDDFEPQFFADYQADVGWLGTPYVWNADFDPETRTIHAFAKARGIGDCGTIGTWQWNGYLFQLTEMRARACSDDIDPEAEMPEFPIIYAGEPVATP